MSMTDRALRALLRLTPREFHERHATDFLDTHRARAAEASQRGWAAATWLTATELAGVVRLIVRLRLEDLDSSRLEGSRGPGGRPRARWYTSVWQDVRFALRTLRRNPGYAGAAVTVLALGIGPTSAMFSAVNAFFFRPLPFADSHRLAMIYETNPEFGWTDVQAAPANVLDWREGVTAFEDVAMYSEFVGQAPYIVDGEPTLVGVSQVTGNFFSVLGILPALGRAFDWEETWDGSDDVVVLSHDLWVSGFGADPTVVGRIIEIGGRQVEVVGVMPAGFRFPSARVDLWSTWGWAASDRDEVFFRRAHFVRPIARLVPGVTHEQANAQLQVVVGQLQSQYPETNSVMGAGMMPLRDFLIRDVRTPLTVLLGAVGLLLLLACANVANLTLVRAADRVREVALRHALGAGRVRVARQMITESAVVGLVGGVIGLGIGWIGVRGIERLTPLGIDGATSVALDLRVFLFTFLAALGSGVLFGLVPALGAMGRNLHVRMIEGGRGGSAGPARTRAAGFLVTTEVALALLLVIGAGLMTRSFSLIRLVDPGFRTENTVAVQFTVPEAGYPDRDQVLAFYDGFAEALEARPGIERVGTVAQLPLSGTNWSSQFQAEGWPPERVGFEISHRRADNGYFEALGIPLVRGRLFEPTDREGAPLVVVINETFAQEHFPNEDPIGQRIAYDRSATPESTWHEIIGIVGDQHQVSPTLEPRAEVFENRNQDWGRSNWVVLSTTGDPAAILPTVRSVLAELDSTIPIAEERTLQAVWQESVAREEFVLTLLAIFGAVALLVASVGVYAVTAQAARKRTHEIGIRMALGAAASHVVALVLRRSIALVAVGLVIGLGLSLIATRALGSVLFGVEPNDPFTLASAVILLALVGVVACYLPARRATTVDTAQLLRTE